MLKKTVTNRASWRRVVGALGALGIGLAAASAFADVVLIPGTVNGTVSFGNWAYSGGNVSLSGAGDPNNSYGSMSFSGSTFALVVPGGLTYKNQSISLNKYDSATQSQQYASFSPNVDVAVPSGGSVDVTFSQDAGFIAPAVALTGGTIVSSEFAAQNYVDGKYSSGSAYGNSATLPKIPITVGSSINLYNAKIKVDVADPANPGTVLCRTDVLLGSQTLTVTANTDTAASYEVTVGVSNCSRGLQGVIQYLGAPPEATFQYGYVQTYGPGYVYQQISSADTTYKIDGLAVGDWYMSVVMYFGANWGNYLQFPNQNPSKVTLLADSGMVTRDFIFNSTKATGSVDVTGVWAGRLSNGSVNFNGSYDSTQTNGGPTYGGYASAQVTGSTGAYTAYLTPGKWSSNYASLSFSENQPGQVPVSSTMYVYKTYEAFDSTTTATATGPTITVPTSETSIVFDVIEQPGEADINIQYANINGSHYDSATGTSYQIYANSQWNLQPTHTVRVVGVPGTYNITATGQVNGSNTTFGTAVITLGEAVGTPAGTNVEVTPKDSDGQDSGVDLTFSNVSGAGNTTAGYATFGPGAPAGYTMLNVVTDKKYLNISSSAVFNGPVQVCLSYDPAALGITAGQESELVLQQYVCNTQNVCAWQVINGTLDGSASIDTTNNVICGTTTSLSTFSITLPIDNCATNGGGCAADATCAKTGPGTHTCTCKAGFKGDGYSCIVACQPSDCEDNNVCTTESCNSEGQCVHSNNDGASCSDNSACTSGDLCAGGSCAGGSPVICEDNNPCTTDSCDASAGCVNATGPDSDSDGTLDCIDNCVALANADQANLDSDGQGDACDGDDDNDGTPDVGNPNCTATLYAGTNYTGTSQSFGAGVHDYPAIFKVGNDSTQSIKVSGVKFVELWQHYTPYNGQTFTGAHATFTADDANTNDNGIGGVSSLYVVCPIGDNCPVNANADQLDTDKDGQGDACDGDDDNDGVADGSDNCPLVVNANQADNESDGKGDACDADDDNDGVVDSSDNCPMASNEDQANNGDDGLGNACDDDDDNDGVADLSDNCQMAANGNQTDTDADGQGDVCDGDDDNDGVLDDVDNCVTAANADQADLTSDGQGDACDADDDKDGVADTSDNCPVISNAGQADQDADNIGDLCDLDIDGDTVDNDADNCKTTANADQADNESDGQGDACDGDDDNDSVADSGDNCQFTANGDQANNDGDTQGDLCDDDDDNDTVADGSDNCAFTANSNQQNTDGDQLGDACDPDLDGDGVANVLDNCLSTINSDQADLDLDGQGDACDGDLDGDGVANALDNCPVAANGTQVDQDADGLGDACDSDIDGDTVSNNNDNCWMVANTNQINTDGDAQGNACDADDDNDGVLDGADNCALVANTNQLNTDGDSQGDACDADDDNDGVLDGADLCAGSVAGAIVDPANGCSIPQLCPCAGPRGTTLAWKDHGKYVECVEKAVKTLKKKGLISCKGEGSIVSAAGKSSCGKKPKKADECKSKDDDDKKYEKDHDKDCEKKSCEKDD